MMKAGIVVFPGSNCEADCHHVFEIMGEDVQYVWHTSPSLDDLDCLVIPGGFSFGDYLRPGAIASHSPVADAIRNFADAGNLVLGICNGFQILTELNLLPGALLQNNSTRFICKNVQLNIGNFTSPFTAEFDPWDSPWMPVAHNEGRYHVDTKTYEKLVEKRQIIFKYVDDINGSVNHIAGVANEKGNVLGMMPHPERAAESILGSVSGLTLFQSMKNHIDGEAS